MPINNDDNTTVGDLVEEFAGLLAEVKRGASLFCKGMRFLLREAIDELDKEFHDASHR